MKQALMTYWPQIVSVVYVLAAAAINAMEEPDEHSSRRYRYLYRFLNALPIPTLPRRGGAESARFPIPKP